MTRIFLGALAALLSLAVQAQGWPAKPIRLVVPFAPGGTSSIVARSVAAEMSKGLGQEVYIENKPGGGGNVAMQEVARAEPDGTTLIIGHLGTLAVNPFMFEMLPFDTNRDFAAVSLLAKVPNIFVVHADVPAKDLREFVALAKAQRLQVLPEAGTVAEQGYPGFETTQWYGLNAPAKTPAAIIQRLADEAAKAAKHPSVAARFAADDAEGIGSTPQEYAEFIAAEQARWGEVVRKAGIKAN